MSQQQKSKWERTRSKGMWRFVLLWTIALGGTMIVVTALFDYVVTSNWPRLESIKIKVPIFLISAFIGGLAMWFLSMYEEELAVQLKK